MQKVRTLTKPEPPPAPPRHLSRRSRALWRSLIPRRAVSPERITLIEHALELLDTADQCRRIIKSQGRTFKTARSNVRHLHPLVLVEQRARAAFVKTWRALHLDFCPVTDAVILDDDDAVD
jgi:phage terminase small subunit